MPADQIVQLCVGAVLLFAGRRAFWLFVGLVGYLVGFELAEQVLPTQPVWVAWVAGLGLGVAAALLAMFFQLLAAGIAGFAVGLYAALEMLGPEARSWVGVLCGVVGAIVAVAIFGWALVLLSALAGAAGIVDALELLPGLRVVAFVCLAALGIAVQAAGMKRRPARRR